jgi:esterase
MELKFIGDDRLAYLDAGGEGMAIIALHGHFGRARHFAGLAEALAGQYRVVALEQRGHGWSRKTADYTRQGNLDDLLFLLDTLDLEQVILLGFSLGGVNAYQFAARFPSRVRALIIEDVGAVVKDDLSYILDWPRRFASIRAAQGFLTQKVQGSGLYFMESLVEDAGGWGFNFDHEGMVRSQQNVNGEWWDDWLTSTCPALLLHGGKSTTLSAEHAQDMATRRPNTRLITMPECGHGLINCDFAGYVAAIKSFLSDV